MLGCLDIGPLFWVPVGLGVPHWDSGDVGQAYTAALPLVTLGLGLPLAAGAAIGRRRWVMLSSSASLCLGTLLIIAPLVYAAGLVMAWWAGSDPLRAFGLKAVVTEGLWRAVVYPLLYLWLGLKGLKWAQAHK